MKRGTTKANAWVMALLVSTAFGCTTLTNFMGSGKGSKPASTEPSGLDRQIVVQQANSDTGILSAMGREQWVSIRNSTKSGTTKIYADLGAREWVIAAQEARATLKKKPKDFAALLVLTTSLAMQHDYQLANFYAEQLDHYYPGRSEVMNVRALAALNRPKAEMKDYKEAMGLFRQAFDNNPTEVAAGLNLAQLYLETGEPTLALETFQTVSSRCDRCYQAEMGIGIAAGRLGQFDDAKKSFTRVLDKSPNNPQALFRLALIEQTGYNNKQKAKTYLKQLLAEAPDSAKELKRRANFLLRSMEANENAVKTEVADENLHEADAAATVKASDKAAPTPATP